MYIFQIDEIAHAIIYGKLGIIKILKGMELEVSDDSDEESVFRLVLEHQEDERVRKELVRIHKGTPYHRHCHNCIEAIQPLAKKGQVIKKAIIAEKASK